MTKCKLVPVELWRELEPYLGKDVPDREVVLLSDVKGVLAAPQPPKLSDKRLFHYAAEIRKALEPDPVGATLNIVALLRTIEREILGGEHD